jgi:glucose-6-phosphate 1-dehydrogenase
LFREIDWEDEGYCIGSQRQEDKCYSKYKELLAHTWQNEEGLDKRADKKELTWKIVEKIRENF